MGVRDVKYRVGQALLVCGFAGIAAGVVWVVPDYIMSAQYGELAASARSEAASEPVSETDATQGADSADVGYEAGVESSEDASGGQSVDFSYLRDVNSDCVGWIQVASKGIDFPVMQSDDNEYYLHHDIYGRYGYGGVFLDHRASADGKTGIIYGHTLIGGGMFTELGVADEEGELTTIGDVVWTTPASGAVHYTPIATMHVYPDFADHQEFSWSYTAAQLEAAKSELVSKKAAAGVWNLEASRGSSAPLALSAKLAGTGDLDRYYVYTDADASAAADIAETYAWREWLRGLCAQSTQVAEDADALIDSSERSMLLACCSWPFDSHRTIVICVAS